MLRMLPRLLGKPLVTRTRRWRTPHIAQSRSPHKRRNFIRASRPTSPHSQRINGEVGIPSPRGMVSTSHRLGHNQATARGKCVDDRSKKSLNRFVGMIVEYAHERNCIGPDGEGVIPETTGPNRHSVRDASRIESILSRGYNSGQIEECRLEVRKRCERSRQERAGPAAHVQEM